MTISCLLCHTLSEKTFCCRGCQAVYEILEKQGVEGDYTKTSLFAQAEKFGVLRGREGVLEAQDASVPLEKWRGSIEGLLCPTCCQLLVYVLEQQKGVDKAVVDWSTDFFLIEYDPMRIGVDRLQEVIESLGYVPLSLDLGTSSAWSKKIGAHVASSAFFALNIMMFSYPILTGLFLQDHIGYTQLFSQLSLLFALPVLLLHALPIMSKALHAARFGFFGMECLISIAVCASFALSVYHTWLGSLHVYYDTLAVLVCLYWVGKWIEGRAKVSTKEKMVSLWACLPNKVAVLCQGKEVVRCIKEVTRDDIVVLYGGETLLLDIEVVSGQALLDASSITGESLPVRAEPGVQIQSGSRLLEGRIEARVVETLETSHHQRMLDLVEKTLDTKRVEASILDRLLHLFTPSVVLLSATFVWSDPSRALEILLISCPCAIGLAYPLVESRLLFALLDQGLLVRNRNALGSMGRHEVMVFDKTGTLTDPSQTRVEGLSELSDFEKRDLLGLVLSSKHPVSRSIQKALGSIDGVEACGQEVLGLGVTSDRAWVGSRRFFQQLGHSHDLEGDLFFQQKGGQLRPLFLEEVLEPSCQSLCFDHSVLLSGDSQEKVERLAKKLQIPRFFATQTPLEKFAVIEQLRSEGLVAYVGDGVNDAPAMSASDISYAPLGASSMCSETADVYLLHNNLGLIGQGEQLAHQARCLQTQNLAFAFVYNVCGIPLAMAGFLTPLHATLAMMCSSLMVLGNSCRMRLSKKEIAHDRGVKKSENGG